MTPNIYLAKLLADERERDILRHVERQHRVRAAAEARRTSLLVRLRRIDRESEPQAEPLTESVTGDTWAA